MRECCEITNPLNRDGTSQPQRFPLALAEDYVEIDERGTADLLNFSRRMAAEFNYYNGANTIDGTWAEFFQDDYSFLLADISELDRERYRTAFYLILDEARDELEINGDGTDLSLLISQLFEFFLSEVDDPEEAGSTLRPWAYLIDEWYDLLPSSDLFEDDAVQFSFKDEVGEARAKLTAFIVKLQLAHYESADNLTDFPSPIDDTLYTSLEEDWGVSVIPGPFVDYEYYHHPELDTSIEKVLELLKASFDTFQGMVASLQDRVESFLEDSFTEYPYHNPQNGLFLAFIQLFKHAQDHINTLGRKHLLYHYQDVLRFSQQAATPDQVALVFNLRKGVDKHLIEEGTLLKAGKDVDGNPMLYQTDREIVVNQAKIVEIRTVFVEREEDTSADDSTGIAPCWEVEEVVEEEIAEGGEVAEEELGTVLGIYSAPVANSSDGIGGDLDEEEPKWNTFGEPQSELDTDDRSMEDANLGFAVASPVFMMKEGSRKIRLTIWLAQDSSNPFVELTSKTDRYIAEADILQGLEASFSSEKGWEEAEVTKVFTVSDNIQNLAHSSSLGDFDSAGIDFDDHLLLCIEVSLNKTNSPFVQYDPELHEGDFATTWPLLKLSFGSDSNGYSDLGISAFNSGVSYQEGALVLFEGNVYQASSAGVKNSISALDPVEDYADTLELKFDAYDPNTTYYTADKVFLDGAVYNAIGTGFSNKTPSDHTDLWVELDFSTCIYSLLDNNQPEKISVDVEAEELQGVLLENDNGQLKPAKPFPPFGSAPASGSRWLIGSKEIFGKDLDEVVIKLKWLDPPRRFSIYYSEYVADLSSVSSMANGEFEASIGMLVDGEWEELTPDQDIFRTYSFWSNYQGARSEKTITLASSKFEGFGRDLDLSEPKQFSSALSRGFLRFELNSPSIAFGHKEYQDIFVNRMQDNADFIANGTANGQTGLQSIPELPYNPVIKEFNISYKSSEEVDLKSAGKANYDARVEQFFHLHPFGHTEEHPYLWGEETGSLVPAFEEEGYLYLGIEDLELPSTLSVLFQLAEGTAEPELERYAPTWSILAENRWVELDAAEIIFDSSDELISSGVIQFDLSREMTTDDTLFDGSYRWIRASVSKHTAAIHQALDIQAQAVLASFLDQDNNPEHLRTALPEGTITGLKTNDPSVKKVSQPYSSFGGKLPEESEEFLTRVSERLRHKHRSINIWDYERMVLEEFPAVYKVKCLNHTQADIAGGQDLEIAPGHVTVVTIPDLRNVNAVNPFEPKTPLYVLNDIDEFLNDYITPWVQLQVTNPLYEKIMIRCEIGLYEGKDPGFYIQKLEEEIKQFLSPWAFDFEEEIVFGGELHESLVINFIEQRDYVDFVINFEMDQILSDGTTTTDVKEAIATTSRSILVSSLEHSITSVKAPEA